MTDTDKLEPGWYWVRRGDGGQWEPARFYGRALWREWDSLWCTNVPAAIIGPRLTPPEKE